MTTRSEFLATFAAPVVFQEPARLASPPSWVEHVPFALWAVGACEPRVLVELGTYSGTSYCAFCQAVAYLKLSTSCYAVDTWVGDEHASYYSDEVFEDLSAYHASLYAGFSRLIRSTFDKALEHFADSSVDLLHIDGLHSYEAVRHDFESWRPKLSERAVVLFHDTNVRENQFGVWQYWQELQKEFPSFSFLHGHGLGVLFVGKEIPPGIRILADQNLSQSQVHDIRKFFSSQGRAALSALKSRQATEDLSETRNQLLDREQQLANSAERITTLESERQELSRIKAELQSGLDSIRQELNQALEQKGELHQQIESQRGRLEALLTEEQSYRNRLEQELTQTASRVTKLIAREKSLVEQLRNSRLRYSALAVELTQNQALLRRFAGSISWKLTRPLRGLGRLYRSRSFFRVRKVIRAAYWTASGKGSAWRERERALRLMRESTLFDEQFYLDQNPELRILGVSPLEHYLDSGGHEGRSPHILFDAEFYLRHNPDVARIGCNPLLHFIEQGASEKRDPHPLFDTAHYLSGAQKCAASGLNPLAYFIKFGADEAISPHPLFDWRFYSDSFADLQGLNLLIHYLRFGVREGRSCQTLFDREYYLDRYQDVALSTLDPFIHFVLQGGIELRDPNPLFDSRFYFERYGENLKAQDYPLAHFLRIGSTLGFNPNPYFDVRYYLDRNTDVALSSLNPLAHYLHFGWKERRDPSQLFSTGHYLDNNPDVVRSNLNPLAHFFLYGLSEGRKPSATQQLKVSQRGEDWESYLPTKSPASEQPVLASAVSVIVPVYRGLRVTKACLESVLQSSNSTPIRLIVIDDRSPEPEVVDYLKSLPQDIRLEVIHNPVNLGFVGTVNKGMELYPDSDVVLLNSDTVVPNHWLDRLVGQAYSAGQVGTVTPFSNNATICNFPTLQGFSQLPADQTVDQISEACSEANLGRSVEIPTAVGFCMYILRDCLTDVGLFDIAAFGKGYGEENDFCLKATAKGWKHLLATDAFVFHEGEASFQSESSPGKKAAAKVIRERYPYYEDLVAQHVTADLAAPYRIAASASLLKRSRQPVILLITHILAGGTERHIQELIRELGSRVQFLILRPTAEPYESSDVSLELTSAGERLQFVVAGQARDKFLKEYLSACGVKRVHLHHTMGFRNSILSLIETLGIPYDVTVHDYLAICPQIHLNDKNGSYCGEPGQDGCVDCLRERPAAGVYDITWWRLRHKTLLKRAERVICPTNDVAERLSRYFPGLNYLVVPHENPASRGRMSVEAPKKGGSLRIAVLGVLSPTKGAKTVEQLVMAVQEQNLPIHLTVIGSLAEEPRKRIERYITHTGGYPDGELETLLDSVDPHIIWFPARVPETYSYTLSTALRSGRPIVAARLGAFIERCADDPWTWLVDWNASQDDILALFQEIVSQLENSRALPIAREQQDNSTPTLADFYHHDYLLPLEMSQSREIHDLRTSAITAVVLPELMGGSPSPCSFIRLLLPLTHDAVAREDLEVLVLSLEESLKCKSDVLIVNRLSVGDIYAVDSLLTHCRNNGIKVVYELDDDIFLMGGHSEQAHYTAGLPAALRLLIGADEVWVSTPILKERLSCLNGHIRVFLNALDERLWLDHHDSVKVFPRQLSRVTRLVYMGTRTHNAELELISPALERLKKEFGPKIDIQLIGVAVEGDSIPWWATLVNVPSFPGGSYPAFVRWLCEKRPYDIGLCPLVESAFNEGKSAIKILDYLALGATPICSAVEPYASTILNASTPDLAGTPIALAVPNSTEAWYQALKELIEQPELQASILARGRNWLLSEGILKVTAPDRVVALQELVSRTTTRQDTIEVLQNPEKDQQLLDRFGDYKLRRILSASYLVGEGIEVGALQNPLPVTARATVKYVDRLRREDLYREYPELRDQNVVDPDIVDNGETLATVPSASLDFVIANHFLEHCENPLLALENFLRVLRPGGTIFLALPDKRFTFDRDRQTTDLAHVVNDYLQGPEQSRSVHYREWAEFVEPHFGRVYTAGEALEERAHQLMTQQYSVHFHNWTPIEVCDILNFARKELDFPLMVEFFFSYSEEMILILRKSALNTVDSPEMAPLSSIPEREELLVAGAG